MSSREGSPQWKEIHEEAIILDLHAHPSLKVSLLRRLLTLNNRATRSFDPFSVRTDFPKLISGGVSALSSVIYAPEKGLLDDCRYLWFIRKVLPISEKILEGQYFDITIAMMDEIEKAVRESEDPDTGRPLARMAFSIRELDEILADVKGGTVAFVHCVEGAHSIEGKIENLELLFERGVVYMTLAHFYENDVAPPVFPFPESMQKLGCFRGRRDLTLGLTKIGEQVVEKMIALGMLIDVTHCTPTTRKRVYEIVGTQAPILATHVGAYKINPNPYNLQDWEIQRIAETGGVVGAIFMNYWLVPHERKRGLDFIARSINHFANVAGFEHIAIGSDFDGFTDPPDDLADASELPFLTQRLVAEGFTREQILKILGGNALRVLHEGWGKKE